MDTATALQTPEILDLMQVVTAPVPIEKFRRLPDCGGCVDFANLPATAEMNGLLRDHIRFCHAGLVIVSSD